MTQHHILPDLSLQKFGVQNKLHNVYFDSLVFKTKKNTMTTSISRGCDTYMFNICHIHSLQLSQCNCALTTVPYCTRYIKKLFNAHVLYCTGSLSDLTPTVYHFQVLLHSAYELTGLR